MDDGPTHVLADASRTGFKQALLEFKKGNEWTRNWTKATKRRTRFAALEVWHSPSCGRGFLSTASKAFLRSTFSLSYRKEALHSPLPPRRGSLVPMVEPSTLRNFSEPGQVND